MSVPSGDAVLTKPQPQLDATPPVGDVASGRAAADIYSRDNQKHWQTVLQGDTTAAAKALPPLELYQPEVSAQVTSDTASLGNSPAPKGASDSTASQSQPTTDHAKDPPLVVAHTDAGLPEPTLDQPDISIQPDAKGGGAIQPDISFQPDIQIATADVPTIDGTAYFLPVSDSDLPPLGPPDGYGDAPLIATAPIDPSYAPDTGYGPDTGGDTGSYGRSDISYASGDPSANYDSSSGDPGDGSQNAQASAADSGGQDVAQTAGQDTAPADDTNLKVALDDSGRPITDQGLVTSPEQQAELQAKANSPGTEDENGDTVGRNKFDGKEKKGVPGLKAAQMEALDAMSEIKSTNEMTPEEQRKLLNAVSKLETVEQASIDGNNLGEFKVAKKFDSIGESYLQTYSAKDYPRQSHDRREIADNGHVAGLFKPSESYVRFEQLLNNSKNYGLPDLMIINHEDPTAMVSPGLEI